MPELTLELYKEVFSFPVIDYYRKIGFDLNKESFENLSVEFIDAYNQALGSAPLAASAVRVLDHFKKTGKINIIISAMKQDMLVKSVKSKNLEGYFSAILGIDDIYAASKSHIAIEYVESHGLKVDGMVLIGDTEHDYEVAEEIGCRCILISDGHQSEQRLLATGARVVSSLDDLIHE
jgi:phosphoglycolate phosphatase